ncbi:MAG: alpha/beta fold hydrolase [Flavipsychrobacter sp.]
MSKKVSKIITYILVVCSFSSCGIFINNPKYVERNIKTSNTYKSNLGTFYCLQDGQCVFVDERIEKESGNIIVALHGLGAHAGSFSFLQEYLDGQNVSSIALDFRGFGHYQGLKGDLKNIGIQVEDLHEIIISIRKRYPSRKIVLLGESLGSSLAIWYVQLHPENVDGLVLTSIVTSKGNGDVKLSTILNLLLAYTFQPSTPVHLGYDPYIYSNDSSFINWAFNIDTLGTRAVSPRYLVQSNRVIKKSYGYLCKYPKPILIIQGGQDFLSTREKTTSLIEKCDSKNIRYLFFPNMLHSIVNDKNRDEAFEGIMQWLNTLE